MPNLPESHPPRPRDGVFGPGFRRFPTQLVPGGNTFADHQTDQTQTNQNPIQLAISGPPRGEEDIVLSCNVCMEKYTDDRYPIILPDCGHSMCVHCDRRQRNERDVCVCATCRTPRQVNRSPDSHSKKNYALLDVVNMYKSEQVNRAAVIKELLDLQTQKAEEGLEEDWMECSSCKYRERKERLQICETCVGEENLKKYELKEEENKEKEEEKRQIYETYVGEVNKEKEEEKLRALWERKENLWMYDMTEDMERELIFPHVLCAYCCQFAPEHKEHHFRFYLPWRLKQLLLSTVTHGEVPVSMLDADYFAKYREGKRNLEKWTEKLHSFVTAPVNAKKFSEAMVIVDALNQEADLVYNVSEYMLTPLTNFTNTLEDSLSRLDEWTEDIKEGRPINIRKVEEKVQNSCDVPSVTIAAEYEANIRRLEKRIRKKDRRIEELEEVVRNGVGDDDVASRVSSTGAVRTEYYGRVNSPCDSVRSEPLPVIAQYYWGDDSPNNSWNDSVWLGGPRQPVPFVGFGPGFGAAIPSPQARGE